jgi:hypothetical protein
MFHQGFPLRSNKRLTSPPLTPRARSQKACYEDNLVLFFQQHNRSEKGKSETQSKLN